MCEVQGRQTPTQPPRKGRRAYRRQTSGKTRATSLSCHLQCRGCGHAHVGWLLALCVREVLA